MKYITELREGDRIADIYLCKYKQAATTKNGKSYENVILQDKTGTVDAKVWEPNSAGISDYDALDYIEVFGDVVSFQGALQVNIKRIRVCKEDEYQASDYLPVSKKGIAPMYQELKEVINSIENVYLQQLMLDIFVNDKDLAKKFCYSSAAKSIHHGFVGGLLEHSLSVVSLCEQYCKMYPLLQRDLLLAAAMCHDLGKTKELSAFPENDYTDVGQLLGHIVMGVEIINDKIRDIDGFPESIATQLKHCILSHHGKLEYGSPKVPALLEALALNFADETDAKIQTFTEVLESANEPGWLGYNRLFETNIRSTIS